MKITIDDGNFIIEIMKDVSVLWRNDDNTFITTMSIYNSDNLLLKRFRFSDNTAELFYMYLMKMIDNPLDNNDILDRVSDSSYRMNTLSIPYDPKGELGPISITLIREIDCCMMSVISNSGTIQIALHEQDVMVLANLIHGAYGVISNT